MKTRYTVGAKVRFRLGPKSVAGTVTQDLEKP